MIGLRGMAHVAICRSEIENNAPSGRTAGQGLGQLGETAMLELVYSELEESVDKALKALRRQRPDYELWRDFPYEYEVDRLAIDLINGGELLRQWVDDPEATPDDLEALAGTDDAVEAFVRNRNVLRKSG